MKIKTFLALSAIASVGLLPLVGLAGGTTSPTEAPMVDDVIAFLDKIRDWLFTFLLIVAVIFFILAAYDFVTAGGNPEKVDSARQKLIYGVIGIIIALVARGIVSFLYQSFGTTAK